MNDRADCRVTPKTFHHSEWMGWKMSKGELARKMC